MNPYQPPTINEDNLVWSSMFKTIGRVLVTGYGLLISAIGIAGLALEILTENNAVRATLWAIPTFAMCFGTFAFAIPQLRYQRLAPFWLYVAYALPILSYLELALDYQKGEYGSDENEWIFVFVLFVIITTPAFIFNWLLGRRLRHLAMVTKHDAIG